MFYKVPIHLVCYKFFQRMGAVAEIILQIKSTYRWNSSNKKYLILDYFNTEKFPIGTGTG